MSQNKCKSSVRYPYNCTIYAKEIQNRQFHENRLKKIRPFSHECSSVHYLHTHDLLPKIRNISFIKQKKNKKGEQINHKFIQTKKYKQFFIDSKLRRKLNKYLLFIAIVNYSLQRSYHSHQPRIYTVYIAKGNNSKLVKKIFKSRFWWNITKDPENSNINLIWSQWSKHNIFQQLQQPTIYKHEIREKDNDKFFIKKNHIHEEYSENNGMIWCRKIISGNIIKQSYLSQLKEIMKLQKYHKRQEIKLTYNHIENHQQITNKKNLFYNLQKYCLQNNDNCLNYIPLTFHITNEYSEYTEIIKYQQNLQQKKQKQKHMWIVKPGQNSNRGSGIQICRKVQTIHKYIEKQRNKHPQRTFIVQKYITPFLFNKRKFDIRVLVLVTATPQISVYYYPQSYLRTSSQQYTNKICNNKIIHLTNDAIQKKGNQYSKFEKGNKVSLEQFQKYLDLIYIKKNYNFIQDLQPKIKDIIVKTIKCNSKFNQNNKAHSFQLLGYDFMIDQNFKIWLIQINTNPCLETGCTLLSEIIPFILQNTIKIAVDSVFKPPKIDSWSLNNLFSCPQSLLEGNKFELIYSEING